VIAVVANAILAVRGVRSVRLYRSALVLQAGIVAAAAAVPALPAAASGSLVRPARLARYYVLVTAAIAAGLWDHLREGTPDTWEREAETR
jgi:hypothetical protein